MVEAKMVGKRYMRKQAVRDVNLVLEDGKVADLGTHAQLIARPGLYKEIYDIQMSSDDRRLIQEGGEA